MRIVLVAVNDGLLRFPCERAILLSHSEDWSGCLVPLLLSSPTSRMNAESDAPKTSSRLCVRTASEQTQAYNKRGMLPYGSFALPVCGHVERVRSVAPDVLKPLLRIGTRQTAQREQPRHEGCFSHQLLLPSPYLILTKPLRLDIQCQRGASVKIGWKYLDD